MKIIDILQRHLAERTPCFSFEYYPPKSRENWADFYEKIQRMSRLSPQFIDVTWGTGDPTSMATVEISREIQARTHVDTMMHLTCTHRSRAELLELLERVVGESEIRNILALRGNRPVGGRWVSHPDGFQNAAELVAGIRAQFGDLFSIAVAGYPEGYRDDGNAPDRDFIGTRDYYRQIERQKDKLDVGAGFIVTQLCFDLDQLCRYREDCEKYGIRCPIVPGILPIHSASTWEKVATFSASIPSDIDRRYHDAIARGPQAFEDFAVSLLLEQVEFLHAHGFWAIHLYTLNHEKIISKAMRLLASESKP